MPSGQNNWNQILSSKRRRNKGDLSKLQARLWHAINCCSAGIDADLGTDDCESARRWIHCLGQISSVYVKVVLDSDIEQRLKALEKLMGGEQQ